MNRKTKGGNAPTTRIYQEPPLLLKLPKMNEPLKRYTHANDGTRGVGLAQGAKLLTGLD